MKNQAMRRLAAHFASLNLLVLLVFCLAALAAPPAAEAQQVTKACGPKWLKKAMKLTPEQRAWMLRRTTAELAWDLDGDGRTDTVKLTSNPNFRDCHVKQVWNEKENTVRIDYADGKAQIIDWIGDQLVEKLVVVEASGRILVGGVSSEGRKLSRWVEYRRAPAAPALPAGTMVAELPAAGTPAAGTPAAGTPAEQPLRLASLDTHR